VMAALSMSCIRVYVCVSCVLSESCHVYVCVESVMGVC